MRYAALSLAFVVALAPAIARAATLPGHVVLARASGKAIVLYDVTPEVAAIVREKTSDGDANDRLELDAIRALATEAPNLTDASSVVLRVTYLENGDVSPVYGTPTFAGIERYAELTCSGAALHAGASSLQRASTVATVPPWLKFEIIGKLPPR